MCATQNREGLCDGCMEIYDLDDLTTDEQDGFRYRYCPDCWSEIEREAEEGDQTARGSYYSGIAGAGEE